jgi:hypothetical protein
MKINDDDIERIKDKKIQITFWHPYFELIPLYSKEYKLEITNSEHLSGKCTAYCYYSKRGLLSKIEWLSKRSTEIVRFQKSKEDKIGLFMQTVYPNVKMKMDLVDYY